MCYIYDTPRVMWEHGGLACVKEARSGEVSRGEISMNVFFTTSLHQRGCEG